MKLNESLFFSKTYDFLHVYIPKEKAGSNHTLTAYKQGLKTFRQYVNETAHISTNRFEFKNCTYDFILDYRNYLHDVKNLKESTVNNKLSAIKSYMHYVSARDVSLQQYMFSVEQVPYYSEPKEHQPIIENVDALAALLNMPSNTRKGLRDKVILAILYDSAIRVTELVSLEVRHVFFENDDIRLRIHGKGNKERCVVVDRKTTALIKQYEKEFHTIRNPSDPFIYTVIDGKRKHMSTRNVEKLIKRYSDNNVNNLGNYI